MTPFRRLRSRLSYANVTASLALFIALGGTGYAAVTLPRNSVGSAQLRKQRRRHQGDPPRRRALRRHPQPHDPPQRPRHQAPARRSAARPDRPARPARTPRHTGGHQTSRGCICGGNARDQRARPRHERLSRRVPCRRERLHLHARRSPRFRTAPCSSSRRQGASPCSRAAATTSWCAPSTQPAMPPRRRFI